MRSQVGTFFRQLVRGCLMAAAIAAGLLVYTSFVAKWKEMGWPTIPISALIAADQATGSRQMPMPGIGATYSSNGIRSGVTSTQSSTTTTTRQASLLDADEYAG